MRLSVDKIALKGDNVFFKRSQQSIIGEVITVKNESVIVKISDSDAEKLNIETPLTVVSHKNYEVME